MVTQQGSSTPMQDWVAQALDRMQPILDGIEITDRFYDVEKEALGDILDRVEWLADHFKVLPEPCHGTNECPSWYKGFYAGIKAGGLAAMEELKRRLENESRR